MLNLLANKTTALKILAICWTLLLIAAMLTPGNKFPAVDIFSFQDKAIHFICFGVLSYLWCGVGWDFFLDLSPKNTLALNYFVFGFTAGIIFEFLQRYIPFRSFEISDIIFNEIGGITGLIVHLKFPIEKKNLH